MINLRNKVQLIGSLSNDVEYLQDKTEKPMARVPLETREINQADQSGKVIEIQWHHLIGWGETAEFMKVLMRKGREVAVQGKLQHKQYVDQDGNPRFYSEVVVSEFMVIG